MAADLSFLQLDPQMTLRKGSVSAKRRLVRSVAESAELKWRRTRDRAGVSSKLTFAYFTLPYVSLCGSLPLICQLFSFILPGVR